MDSDPLGFQSHDVRVDVVLALLQSASGMGITTFIQDEAQPVGTNPFENGGDEFAEEAPPPAYESVMMSDSLLMSNGVCFVCQLLPTSPAHGAPTGCSAARSASNHRTCGKHNVHTPSPPPHRTHRARCSPRATQTTLKSWSQSLSSRVKASAPTSRTRSLPKPPCHSTAASTTKSYADFVTLRGFTDD